MFEKCTGTYKTSFFPDTSATARQYFPVHFGVKRIIQLLECSTLQDCQHDKHPLLFLLYGCGAHLRQEDPSGLFVSSELNSSPLV